MTGDRMTRQEVADAAGLTYGTFNVYLNDAKQRVDAGLPPLPHLPPPPDGYVGRTPFWLPATVAAYVARRYATRNEVTP